MWIWQSISVVLAWSYCSWIFFHRWLVQSFQLYSSCFYFASPGTTDANWPVLNMCTVKEKENKSNPKKFLAVIPSTPRWTLLSPSAGLTGGRHGVVRNVSSAALHIKYHGSWSDPMSLASMFLEPGTFLLWCHHDGLETPYMLTRPAEIRFQHLYVMSWNWGRFTRVPSQYGYESTRCGPSPTLTTPTMISTVCKDSEQRGHLVSDLKSLTISELSPPELWTHRFESSFCSSPDCRTQIWRADSVMVARCHQLSPWRPRSFITEMEVPSHLQHRRL